MYDLSDFIDSHPGGEAVLLMEDVAGQDATETFFGLHSIEVLMRPGVKNLIIGKVQDEEPKVHVRIGRKKYMSNTHSTHSPATSQRYPMRSLHGLWRTSIRLTTQSRTIAFDVRCVCSLKSM